MTLIATSIVSLIVLLSKSPYVITVMRGRRWGCYNHVQWMRDTKILKQWTKWNTTGKRKRGKPKETLRRTFERERAK